MFRPNSRFVLLILGLLVTCLNLPALADDEVPAIDPIAVTRVLVADPVDLLLPAFHDEDRNGQDLAGLLADLPAFPGNDWPCPGCGGCSNPALPRPRSRAVTA